MADQKNEKTEPQHDKQPYVPPKIEDVGRVEDVTQANQTSGGTDADTLSF